MNKAYYVYALLDPRKFNAPFYVGKGIRDRYNHHLDGRTDGENKFKDHLINAIRQVGREPGVKILADNITSEKAYDLETWYVLLWGRRNIDPGGILTNICLDRRPPDKTGFKHSEETLRKMRGRTPWNKGLTKENDPKVAKLSEIISEKLKGNIPWNKGLDHTDPRVQKYINNLVPFEKGNIPWNKGTKGVMKPNSGSWGNKPAWNKMNITQEFIDLIQSDNRSQTIIAKDYNISQSLVSQIKLGKRKAN